MGFTTPPPYCGGYGARRFPRWGTTLLVIEAGGTCSKSLAMTKSIVKHVNGIVRFYLDPRSESAAALNGDGSLAPLRDYLESLSEPGRTTPAPGRHALSVWADALGIDWPANNPLVIPAAHDESTEGPKQAQAMDMGAVRRIGILSTNPAVCLLKRAYAAGISPMTYACRRFADAQRLRTPEANEDSARGAVADSKTKKQHGQHWPRDCPLMGITKSTERANPLLEMRASYAKVNGRDMPYTSPRLDYNWTLVAEGSAPYSATRRNHEILRLGIGDSRGEKYTLHSPKNLSPTAADQMSFGRTELTIIGHWSETSRMPERYDRIARAIELLLRNTIVQRMATGRPPPAPAHRIPNSIYGSVRIGKNTEPELPCDVVVATDLAPAVDAPVADTPPVTAVSPSLGETAAENHNERGDQEVDDGVLLQADELEGDIWINLTQTKTPVND